MKTDPLVDALWSIANFASGGVVVRGECSGDRDAMIHTARTALMEYYGAPTFKRAIAARSEELARRR